LHGKAIGKCGRIGTGDAGINDTASVGSVRNSAMVSVVSQFLQIG
jgi:hypothetical protein